MKTLSRDATIANLRRFFGDTGARSVTLPDLFRNAGREGNTHDRNMSWLFNKLTMMNIYELFEKKYAVRNGVRVLDMIELTRAGVEALSANSSHSAEAGSVNPKGSKVLLEDITDLAKVFMEQNPSWEVDIVPKLKQREVQPTK